MLAIGCHLRALCAMHNKVSAMHNQMISEIVPGIRRDFTGRNPTRPEFHEAFFQRCAIGRIQTRGLRVDFQNDLARKREGDTALPASLNKRAYRPPQDDHDAVLDGGVISAKAIPKSRAARAVLFSI
jgi:hypothetical protein